MAKVGQGVLERAFFWPQGSNRLQIGRGKGIMKHKRIPHTAYHGEKFTETALEEDTS